MYGLLLSVLKVLSDLLTAASGVFGLLTEFKDQDKKITRSGKLALSGIIIGFALSGLTTFFEMKNAQQEKEEHSQEVKRLERPLNDRMNAWIVLSVPKEAKDAERYRTLLIEYFKGQLANHVKPDPSIPIFIATPYRGNLQSFVTPYKSMPAKFRGSQSDITEIFDRSIEYSVQLFRSATCESLQGGLTKPDLELGFAVKSLESDPSVTWEYIANDDFLAMSRNLELGVAQGTSRFTSIEDFPGSTMVVWLGSADRHHKLESIQINLGGASLEAHNFTTVWGGGGSQFELPENAAKLGGRKFHGYCYEIPKETGN